MSGNNILVELADGTFLRKSRQQLQPSDMIVIDGPDAFASTDAAENQFDQEIAAAGGFEAWKALDSGFP